MDSQAVFVGNHCLSLITSEATRVMLFQDMDLYEGLKYVDTSSQADKVELTKFPELKRFCSYHVDPKAINDQFDDITDRVSAS